MCFVPAYGANDASRTDANHTVSEYGASLHPFEHRLHASVKVVEVEAQGMMDKTTNEMQDELDHIDANNLDAAEPLAALEPLEAQLMQKVQQSAQAAAAEDAQQEAAEDDRSELSYESANREAEDAIDQAGAEAELQLNSDSPSTH